MIRSSDARSELGVSVPPPARTSASSVSITGNSRPFRARYFSRCGSCQERIVPDDVVRYEKHVLVHDDCGDTQAHEPERPAAPVCSTCWLTKPCECDDD